MSLQSIIIHYGIIIMGLCLIALGLILMSKKKVMVSTLIVSLYFLIPVFIMPLRVIDPDGITFADISYLVLFGPIWICLALFNHGKHCIFNMDYKEFVKEFDMLIALEPSIYKDCSLEDYSVESIIKESDKNILVVDFRDIQKDKTMYRMMIDASKQVLNNHKVSYSARKYGVLIVIVGLYMSIKGVIDLI